MKGQHFSQSLTLSKGAATSVKVHTLADEQQGDKQPHKDLKLTSFVLKEVRNATDIRLDEQLQNVFQRLNQSYSTSINAPHAAFLQQQIDDFFHICQTSYLFNVENRSDKKETGHEG